MEWTTVGHPITNYDHLPPPGKIVVVWLKDHDIPTCGFVFDGRWMVGTTIAPLVISWCDCLPQNGPAMPEAEQYNQDQPEYRKMSNLAINLSIPADKNWPFTAGQCDGCGGNGCDVCGGHGWFADINDPRVRRCAREACGKALMPNHVAVYCSDECAIEDA